MRARLLVVFVPLLLAACGSTHKTVVVNPPPNSSVVVDPDGHAHVVRHDDDRDRYQDNGY